MFIKTERGSRMLNHSLPLLLYCSKSIDYFLSQHSFFSAQSAFLSQAVAQESLAWQQESDSYHNRFIRQLESKTDLVFFGKYPEFFLERSYHLIKIN